MLSSNREKGQHPVESHALSTRHWGLHSGAQEKGTPSFESSIFHLHDEKSEHEHGHTSTSEDDLLKLLNLSQCTQTWTRFDQRAKTYRTTSSSGPLWENVVARITIDDKTGHIMSLEYTKHMTNMADQGQGEKGREEREGGREGGRERGGGRGRGRERGRWRVREGERGWEGGREREGGKDREKDLKQNVRASMWCETTGTQ